LPLEDYPFRERLPEGPPLVLGVGRLVEKKGFHFLLRALAALRRDGAPFRALLIGEGPQRDALEAAIAELGLDEAVALTGWLPHEKVCAAYERASVLVAPSIVAEDGDRDGLPNVVLEVAAMGVPVVATDAGGLPDLVRDGETGWVAVPEDADALAEQIRAALGSPEEAISRARASRAVVEERFEIHRCTDRLISTLGLGLPSG
jgi:glycosyltransferase involved in cell wall biosynthesis